MTVLAQQVKEIGSRTVSHLPTSARSILRADEVDKVLMLDARNVYRKVTRKIYDFSPEQMQNLAAIVWLYRGQRERFLGLVNQEDINEALQIAAFLRLAQERKAGEVSPA